MVGWNNSSNGRARVDDALPAEDGAWIQHHVAADFAVIADYRSELLQASRETAVAAVNYDLFLV